MPRWTDEKRTRRTVSCEYCKKQQVRSPSQIGNRIFCSVACRTATAKTDKTVNGRYAGGKYLPCRQCGSEIYRTPCHLNKDKDNFCSNKCLGAWNSSNRVGEKALAFRNAAKKLVCGQCGKDFETFDTNRVNCSMTCSAKSKLKNKVERVAHYGKAADAA